MTNYSFWQLINEHYVEIPIIQRDYAQGRDTPKSNVIRKSFVKSIVKATKETNTPLHLNFVYGKVRGRLDAKKVEENKKAIEAMLKSVRGYSQSLELDFKYEWGENNHKSRNVTSFLPLDGQQRLTTLFLFHWYLLRRLEIGQDENSKLLNFSYQIRPSTKQFCIELVKCNIDIQNDLSVSEVIEDSSWFFKYWLKDPSVSGMLRMLDEIHSQCFTFTPDEIETIWVNLTDKKSVNFELLDLDQFELTDELYVKMNARGKALTTFENFKSTLMEFIEEKEFIFSVQDWEHKLDTSWADLFWDNKDDENMLIDEEYYIYFRNMMQLYFTLTKDLKVDDKDNLANFQLLAPRRKKKNKHSEFFEEYNTLPLLELEKHGVLTQDNLNKTFEVLDYIAYYKKETPKIYELIKGIFKNFITGDITYPHKVQFYSLVQYLFIFKDRATFEEIEAFLRVQNNLIQNTIIDSIPIMKNIVEGLVIDAQFYRSFYNNIVDNKISFVGFRAEQISEEKLKILLLLKDNEWEQLILEAEKHQYFQAQIGFLLHISNIDSYFDEYGNLNFTPSENDDFKHDFKEYYNVAKHVFKDINIDKKPNNLMNRALLTYGDCLIHDATYRTFPKADKHRDESWYRFMREYKAKSKYLEIWETLESLFNALKSGETLDSIVENNIPNDWRECFVRYPETIDRCGVYQHFRIDNKNIYLLSKNNKRSNYTELETFHLFKSKFESKMIKYSPFISVKYNMGNNNKGEEPCVFLNQFHCGGLDIELAIYHYRYKEQPWEISIAASNGDIVNIKNELDHVLISNNSFVFESEHDEFDASVYLLKLDGNISSIATQIKNICSELNKITQ